MNKRTFLKSTAELRLGSKVWYRARSGTAFSFIAFLLVSCSGAVPGGFWSDFQTGLLQKNNSDQGPNGGSRAMYWKTKKEKTFTSHIVRDFAKKNGWSLVDSLQCSGDNVKNWRLLNENIFPLSDKGFSPEENSEAFKKFPRWINSSITLYRFKTGWLLFEAGTDISTEVNGFAMTNDIGTEMSVYQFWGD